MNKVYNLKPQQEDKRDYIYMSHILQVPSVYFNIKMTTMPILDQGNIGSCLPNATYALFYILSNSSITLSRLQLYMTTRAIDGSSLTQDSGCTIRGCMKAISKYGLCDEKIWPYTISNFAKLAPSQAFTNTYKLTNFIYTFINQDLTSIKQILSSNSPIVLGIYVYSSFESTNASKTGVIPVPNTKMEKLLGGHAILLVSYNDEKQYFQFQNSWGIGWGDNGYGYIPYSYILDKNLSFDLCSVRFF
jgi:C1A family cysteine protease